MVTGGDILHFKQTTHQSNRWLHDSFVIKIVKLNTFNGEKGEENTQIEIGSSVNVIKRILT